VAESLAAVGARDQAGTSATNEAPIFSDGGRARGWGQRGEAGVGDLSGARRVRASCRLARVEADQPDVGEQASTSSRRSLISARLTLLPLARRRLVCRDRERRSYPCRRALLWVDEDALSFVERSALILYSGFDGVRRVLRVLRVLGWLGFSCSREAIASFS